MNVHGVTNTQILHDEVIVNVVYITTRDILGHMAWPILACNDQSINITGLGSAAILSYHSH